MWSLISDSSFAADRKIDKPYDCRRPDREEQLVLQRAPVAPPKNLSAAGPANCFSSSGGAEHRCRAWRQPDIQAPEKPARG